MAKNTIQKVVLLGVGLTLGYNIRSLLNKDKGPQFNAEQLNSMRLHTEYLKKISNIIDDLNVKGLFHAIEQYVPHDDFDSFIKKLPFQLVKSSTSISEDEVPQVFSSVIHSLFRENKDLEEIMHAAHSPQHNTEPTTAYEVLKHIHNNPEIYKALIEGDTPIIQVNKAYFRPNTYDVDYDKLNQVVRNDAENKLQNSMSLDDFTYVDLLNTVAQFQEKSTDLMYKASDFKEDLVELNKYYHNPEANKHLVEQIYSSETCD